MLKLKQEYRLGAIIKSQLFFYLLFGTISFLIDFGGYILLLSVGLPPLVSNIVSLLLSLCFNFYTSSNITFKNNGGNLKKNLVRYIVLLSFNYIVNNSLIFVLTYILNIDAVFAKVIVTILQFMWTYIIFKYWVFKQ